MFGLFTFGKICDLRKKNGVFGDLDDHFGAHASSVKHPLKSCASRIFIGTKIGPPKKEFIGEIFYSVVKLGRPSTLFRRGDFILGGVDFDRWVIFLRITLRIKDK